MRRTRQEAVLANHHTTDIDGRKAIHILVGGDGIDDGHLADVLRQGQLDENAVNRRIRIQGANQFQKFRLGRLGRKTNLTRQHPRLAASLLLRRHITDAGRIVADENHGETGCHAFRLLEFVRTCGNFRAQVGRQKFSIDYLHTRTFPFVLVSLPCFSGGLPPTRHSGLRRP